MSDNDHFLELVQSLKSQCSVSFSDITAWYSEHYHTCETVEAKQLVKPIAEILLNYLESLNLVRMSQFTMDLADSWKGMYFKDLNDEVTVIAPKNIYFRIIYLCCITLMLAKVTDIPGYVELVRENVA
jgi:hypothetical protein